MTALQTTAVVVAAVGAVAIGVEVATNDDPLDVRPDESLNEAVAQAPAGSTVTVHSGTYPKLIVKRRASSPVTIKAAAGEPAPVIAGADVRQSTGWRFDGLHSKGMVFFGEGSRDLVYRNGEVGPASQGFEIKGNPNLGGDTENVTIEDTYIHDVADNGNGASGYGIRASLGGADFITIRRNKITRTQYDAIQMTGIEELVIEENDISEIYEAPVSLGHVDGLQIIAPKGGERIIGNSWRNVQHNIIHSSPRGMLFANNTVVDVKNRCFKIFGGEGASYVNNTFARCVYPGIELRNSTDPPNSADAGPGTPTDLTFANNIVETIVGSPRYRVNSNNLTPAEAQLGSDVELSAGSPAVNGGDPAHAPELDRLGRDRIGLPDIGALEFQTTSEPDPVPDPEPEPEPTPDPEPQPSVRELLLDARRDLQAALDRIDRALAELPG